MLVRLYQSYVKGKQHLFLVVSPFLFAVGDYTYFELLAQSFASETANTLVCNFV